MMTDEVNTLLRQIRDFINHPRIKEELFKNKPLFYQLCSCMDMVEDSQSAVDSFGKQKKQEINKGHVYLEIFGLLQALFLQQDSAVHLAEALQFPVTIDQYPRLKEIREIRNDAAGHPTKRGNPPRSWNFIIQHSAGYDGFEIMCWHSPQGHTRIQVQTAEIIKDQQKYIVDILQKTYGEIKRRDSEYKAKFKMKKIADIFPGTMGYTCEKMGSAIGHGGELTLGEFGASGLLNVLTAFETELKERGIAIDTYPGVGLTFTELKYPLEKLRGYFLGEQALDDEEACIFVDFVRRKMQELKKMGAELDDEFTSGE